MGEYVIYGLDELAPLMNSDPIMMLLFCFTRLYCERGGKKVPHVCCLVNVRVFIGGIKQNGVANNVIWLREKCVESLSRELQQIECALTHNVNHLYVPADCGHILIIYRLMSSYRTPLFWS